MSCHFTEKLYPGQNLSCKTCNPNGLFYNDDIDLG